MGSAMNLYRFTFDSSIDHCSDLRGWVRTIGRIEGYNEKFLSFLELGLQEAFVNAVHHGNGVNPELPVSIVFSCRQIASGRELVVQVTDRGKGFDLDKIEKHIDKRGEDRLNGRGLMIMRHYAEKLNIETSSEGSVLRLHYIPF
ncbi:MAG: ATP-binding protein [Chlorobiaceae bacterium]|nr:ATP-binding protein [Chlorobiaceae bacterium]